MEWWQVALTVLGTLIVVAAVIGIAVANGRNKNATTERTNYKETITSYQGLLEAKSGEVDQLREDFKGLQKETQQAHQANLQEIGRLSGLVEAYSKLPLAELAADMKTIVATQLAIAKHFNIGEIEVLPPKDTKAGGLGVIVTPVQS